MRGEGVGERERGSRGRAVMSDMEKENFSLLGKSFLRKDAVVRVTGCKLARASRSRTAASVEALRTSTGLVRC